MGPLSVPQRGCVSGLSLPQGERRDLSNFSVFFSNSHDPYLNLALEDWIFKNLVHENNTGPILFFYINKPSVIIGRAQNPWLECNLQTMSEDKILLVRRQSGGGAVYHDLGNLNFSVLANLKFFNKTQNLDLMIQALNFFNIKAHRGPRHDLWVGNKKISGCAFRQTKDKAFHHGTLLINADLAALGNYLKSPDENKIQESKGVKSVRSSVMNLSELIKNLKPEDLINKISEKFAEYYSLGTQLIKPRLITPGMIQDATAMMEEFKNFDWLYGKTLPFEITREIKLSDGKVLKANLWIEQGLIKKILDPVDDLRLDFLLNTPLFF